MSKSAWIVIPASPGFFLIAVHPQGATERPIVTRAPVVAWRLDPETLERGEETIAVPISCNTTAHDPRGAMLYPDGRVVELFAEEWESVEAFVADRMRDAAKAKG